MTGATIGPDAGIDGAGLLLAGALGAGAPGGGEGAAPAGRWLPHPAIHPALASTAHTSSRRFGNDVGTFMTLSDEPAPTRRSK